MWIFWAVPTNCEEAGHSPCSHFHLRVTFGNELCQPDGWHKDKMRLFHTHSVWLFLFLLLLFWFGFALLFCSTMLPQLLIWTPKPSHSYFHSWMSIRLFCGVEGQGLLLYHLVGNTSFLNILYVFPLKSRNTLVMRVMLSYC